MKGILRAAAILVALVLSAPSVSAQEDAKKGDVIETDHGVHIPKPDGWVIAKSSNMSAAKLHAAGDPMTEIDFRVTPKLGADKSAQYFTSLHANLQAAGFEKVRDTAKKQLGDVDCEETEYESDLKGVKVRLVTWQFHHGGAAWFVTAIYREGERDRRYAEFIEILKSLKLS